MLQDFYSVFAARILKCIWSFWEIMNRRAEANIFLTLRSKDSTAFMSYPAGNYMFKVNNRNTRTRCDICSKLKIKTPERRQAGVFIVNFEHISYIVLVFLSLTLNM